tara:strand:+ start:57 stop:605 length:549 start_codon:yes stop_codon:yes gene_type:complete
MSKKILITGGPGTGKTALINKLISKGYTCFEEKSREITLSYKKKGIDQLFLSKPLLFSELLLDSRINQYLESKKTKVDHVFFDRGIPDVLAYLGFKKIKYDEKFLNACKDYEYDIVFILRPWEEIFINDKERYENFQELVEIDKCIYKTYTKLNYKVIEIPKTSINNRMDFILQFINNNKSC